MSVGSVWSVWPSVCLHARMPVCSVGYVYLSVTLCVCMSIWSICLINIIAQCWTSPQKHTRTPRRAYALTAYFRLARVQSSGHRQNPPKGVPGPLLDQPPSGGCPILPSGEDRPEEQDYRPDEAKEVRLLWCELFKLSRVLEK